MNIESLLKERNELHGEISRNKYRLNTIEDEIVSIAKEDIKRMYDTYGEIFESEKGFKSYSDNFIETNNIICIDDETHKKKGVMFTSNNIKWSVFLSYGLIEDIITYDIENEIHNKIILCRTSGNKVFMIESTFSNMEKCLKYVANFKRDCE